MSEISSLMPKINFVGNMDKLYNNQVVDFRNSNLTTDNKFQAPVVEVNPTGYKLNQTRVTSLSSTTKNVLNVADSVRDGWRNVSNFTSKVTAAPGAFISNTFKDIKVESGRATNANRWHGVGASNWGAKYKPDAEFKLPSLSLGTGGLDSIASTVKNTLSGWADTAAEAVKSGMSYFSGRSSGIEAIAPGSGKITQDWDQAVANGGSQSPGFLNRVISPLTSLPGAILNGATGFISGKSTLGTMANVFTWPVRTAFSGLNTVYQAVSPTMEGLKDSFLAWFKPEAPQNRVVNEAREVALPEPTMVLPDNGVLTLNGKTIGTDNLA